MNPSTSSPEAPSPSRSRLWGGVRKLSLTAAALAVAIGLFYGIENWRGGRSWAAERAILLRAGTPIELAEIVPPPVPDDQNLARRQPFLDVFDFRRTPQGDLSNTNLQAALDWCSLSSITGNHSMRPPSVGRWSAGEPVDLEGWQRYVRLPPKLQRNDVIAARLRRGLPVPNPTSEAARAPAFPLPTHPGRPAEDVLLALKLFDTDFTTLTEMARLPHGRFPVAYENGLSTLLPHLALLKQLITTLTLRGVASLEEGQPDAALMDSLTSLRLTESVRDEPLVISQLVRYACLQISLQTVWEGQVRHRWSSNQLNEIEQALKPADVEPGIRRALAGERIMMLGTVQQVVASAQGRREIESLFDSLTTWESAQSGATAGSPLLRYSYLSWAPRGWLYASAAEISRALRLLETAPAGNLLALQGHWPPAPPAAGWRYRWYHVYLQPKSDEGLPSTVLKAFRANAHVRLARTACALERHRLAQGAYPDRLEALVPRWIDSVPLDPIDQKPLRYAVEAADRFRLWSVGANGIDDDGTPESPGKPPQANTDVVWAWPR